MYLSFKQNCPVDSPLVTQPPDNSQSCYFSFCAVLPNGESKPKFPAQHAFLHGYPIQGDVLQSLFKIGK